MEYQQRIDQIQEIRTRTGDDPIREVPWSGGST